MDFFSGIDNNLLNWIILPVFIFLARVFDVSIGTLRIILVGKGIRRLATIAGFFEVLVWIIAMGQIMQNLNNYINYLAYAGGFATGTYIGMIIENKLSIGKVVVRIITRRDANELFEHLKKNNYHLTSLDAQGRFGDVKIIFLAINRKELNTLIKIINKFNPRAFYTVEDIRYVNDLDVIRHANPLVMKMSNIRRVFTPRK